MCTTTNKWSVRYANTNPETDHADQEYQHERLQNISRKAWDNCEIRNYASVRVSCHLKSYNGVTGAQALLRLYIMSSEKTYHAHCTLQQSATTADTHAGASKCESTNRLAEPDIWQSIQPKHR